MSVTVREFHRRDREHLAALVNLHLSVVLPGVALSTNVVLSQLEGEPGELILDPWVTERTSLVAEVDQVVVGATLVHHYGSDDSVRPSYRNATEVKWLLFAPDQAAAGAALLGAAEALARRRDAPTLSVDGSLPALGCYGVPQSWPHVGELLTRADFVGPARMERVLAAPCAQLTLHHRTDLRPSRSVGTLGVRIDLHDRDEHLGWIEVGEQHPGLARSATAATWTDVGNLVVDESQDARTVMPALFGAAAVWLQLGGIDRLIDYYAADVHDAVYMDVLAGLGFTELAVHGRGWDKRLR